jgi:hypothetical protein
VVSPTSKKFVNPVPIRAYEEPSKAFNHMYR